ncbi:hypothetical protein BT96DRAFT_578620 [Gymnopus androsaceus JB14]|uniref:Uncharacterized protein n=1 Tax=Gymnopus androsaceus JB14 TaxID=1447944 RepID=A0A6A4GJN5_9AGAR|nr:hypothetical protein BT96DRAFT_578620 [Gymnopus androsaceus JB14]
MFCGRVEDVAIRDSLSRNQRECCRGVWFAGEPRLSSRVERDASRVNQDGRRCLQAPGPRVRGCWG